MGRNGEVSDAIGNCWKNNARSESDIRHKNKKLSFTKKRNFDAKCGWNVEDTMSFNTEKSCTL